MKAFKESLEFYLICCIFKKNFLEHFISIWSFMISMHYFQLNWAIPNGSFRRKKSPLLFMLHSKLLKLLSPKNAKILILVTYLFFFCCNLPWMMQLYPSELRTKPFLQPHSYILLWMLKQIWVQGFPSGGHFPENIEIGTLEVNTLLAHLSDSGNKIISTLPSGC